MPPFQTAPFNPLRWPSLQDAAPSACGRLKNIHPDFEQLLEEGETSRVQILSKGICYLLPREVGDFVRIRLLRTNVYCSSLHRVFAFQHPVLLSFRRNSLICVISQGLSVLPPTTKAKAGVEEAGVGL